MIALVLLIVCFAVYWPSLKGHFVSDDYRIASSFKDPIIPKWYHAPRYLSWLSLSSDYKAWDNTKRPYIFHITNVAIHWLCSWLLSLILLTLGLSPWFALLFVVHPMCCGAVAYITGRFTLLSTFFSLFAILAMLQGNFWLFVLMWCFAEWAKPDMIATLVLVALFGPWYYLSVVLWPLGRIACIRWRDRHSIKQVPIIPKTDSEGIKNGGEVNLLWLAYFLTYITETVKWFPLWMFGLSLKIQTDPPKRSTWKLLMAALCMCLLLVFLVWLPTTYLTLKVGIALLLLSPWLFYSLIPLPQVTLDYRAYMNVAGIVILGGLFLTQPWMILLMSVLFAVSTWHRCQRWNNGIAFWGTSFNEGNKSAWVLIHLATAYVQYNMIAEAEYFIMEGLKLRPNNVAGLSVLQTVAKLKMQCLGEAKDEQV